MSSLADLPELVGFFSYSRQDDEAFRGSLSEVRDAIQRELGAQLGRSKRNFRLWQDHEAIAPGRLWEAEIKTAVEQSVFFIPIITPRLVNSDYCQFEFDAFLARERALGRADLVFPVLYISVPALEDETRWRDDPVLAAIGKRQYVDWRRFRHLDIHSTVVREEIERFANKIVEALHRPWVASEDRREGEALPREAAMEREEGPARQQAAAVARAKAPDVEQRADEPSKRYGERRGERETAEPDTEPKRLTEARERGLERSKAAQRWRPSRRAIVGGSLVAVALLGAIAIWLVAAAATLRFDGFYRSLEGTNPMDLRFYSDGTVIAVASPDTPAQLATWFKKESSSVATGKFIVTGNRLQFSVTAPGGTLDYDGTVKHNGLFLTWVTSYHKPQRHL